VRIAVRRSADQLDGAPSDQSVLGELPPRSGKQQLAYGGISYLDRTAALQLGIVKPEGIDLNFITIPDIGSLFRRMAQFQEFQAAEMSLSTLVMMRDQGNDSLVGIPVFPSRSFRHSFIFVRADSDIESPSELKGARVGVQDYQATACVWLRAHLQHDYAVRPGDITWFVGGLDTPSFIERLTHAPPPNVTIEPIPPGRAIVDMLLTGELDAVLTPERLHGLRVDPPLFRRLIVNYEEVESAFWSRTGVFPIMHVVVIRQDVYKRDPWIALALTKAFQESKEWGSEHLRNPASPATALPWLADALHDLDERFAGDAYPIGFAPNRVALDALATYSHEQGLSHARMRPEDLFAPETLEFGQ
jgi:4,5-dihydroxyphthalate decarboxylase